jgi:hypothetical protein
MAAPDVDEVGDLLKGNEGDPERQRDVAQEIRSLGAAAEIDVEEERILEPADDGKIDGHARPQPQAAARARDRLAEPVIDDQRGHQQREIARLPRRIKNEREHRHRRQRPRP